MKQTKLFVITLLFLASGILSSYFSGKIVGNFLLVNKYGAIRVKSENLKIIKGKPKMVISNGDVFDSSTTFPYYVFCSILTLTFMAGVFILGNLVSKGWLFKSMSSLGFFDQWKNNTSISK
jgi:hypothetical protein